MVFNITGDTSSGDYEDKTKSYVVRKFIDPSLLGIQFKANVTETLNSAGSIEVQSAPEGVESAMVKYEDDTSLFSDEKNHKINILMTGSNSVQSVTSVVHSICTAFIATAPVIVNASTNNVEVK